MRSLQSLLDEVANDAFEESMIEDMDGRTGLQRERELAQRVRPIHYAACVNGKGGVSALCFPNPRPINLKIATWTIREVAVTCDKCGELLRVANNGGRIL